MADRERAAPAQVDRYWRQVEEAPRQAYAHVSLLGLRTCDAVQLHDRIEEGLSFEAFERLREVLDVPASHLARLLRIPPRTLGRRKRAGRLEPDESDRLVRLSRLVGLALQLFEGDLEGMRWWLGTPHGALRDEVPLEFATTEVGARELENLIGRLELGVIP